MSVAIDQDNLPAILARAFLQAWQSYYLPERSGAISEETARPALTKLLVAMAKEGVVEEASLAAAGLRVKMSKRIDAADRPHIIGPLISAHSDPGARNATSG